MRIIFEKSRSIESMMMFNKKKGIKNHLTIEYPQMDFVRREEINANRHVIIK